MDTVDASPVPVNNSLGAVGPRLSESSALSNTAAGVEEGVADVLGTVGEVWNFLCPVACVTLGLEVLVYK